MPTALSLHPPGLERWCLYQLGSRPPPHNLAAASQGPPSLDSRVASLTRGTEQDKLHLSDVQQLQILEVTRLFGVDKERLKAEQQAALHGIQVRWVVPGWVCRDRLNCGRSGPAQWCCCMEASALLLCS